MTGPPSVAPNGWYFVFGFFAGADAKKLLACVASEVLMLIVSIASAEGMRTVSRPVLWLSSRPSICTLFESRDWPLNFVSWLSCGLKNWEWGRVIVTVP